VVLLDLSAAFDLVPPDTLVKKLEIYGLDSDFLAWIESYLSDRHQAVWIDHVMSDFLPCDVGVPQGSNLGPLFFMLYVNDLPFVLTCAIDQYADDSTLHATGKTITEINEALETNCEVVSNWMAENMLKLNADKTHILTLGTRERLAMPGNKVTVSMDDIVLEEDPQQRETLLGIIVDANLK
jgi:ribonuclease P/MRP protein subunit RPP40